jgi:hypothetical protein
MSGVMPEHQDDWMQVSMIRLKSAANNAWSRPRLSALVASRSFRSDGGFVYNSGFVHPARRLTPIVRKFGGQYGKKEIMA